VIELTLDEAREILRHAIGYVDADFDTFPSTVQVNAMAGAINIVRAMQELGWSIAARPTKLATWTRPS
jgi:hypothetical protein